MLKKSGVHTQFVPDYHNIIPTKPYTEDLQGLPVINIRYVPLSNTFNAMLKTDCGYFRRVRGDHSVLTGDAVFLHHDQADLTGPLIYRQTRVGLHNKPFEMYKFRLDGSSDGGERKEGMDREE